MGTTILIGLLDEGTELWRPVEAKQVREGVFQIIGRQPEGERWQFAPGSLFAVASARSVEERATSWPMSWRQRSLRASLDVEVALSLHFGRH
jgi:hypothetical protein